MYTLYLKSPTKGIYKVECATKEIYTMLVPYSVPTPEKK